MTDPRLPEEGRRPGPSRRVRVIGIGSGHPDQLTREAADALAGVAYVIAAAKGEDDPLLDVRRRLCASAGVRLVAVADPERERGRDETSATTAYRGAVRDWHEARVAAYEEVLRAEPGDVAFLVWGDPAFYDSTLRVVDRLRERGAVDFVHDVVPGVSSPQLLAARHRIVLHRVGEPVLVTTGRRLADDVAAGHENLVVMLDGDLACLGLDPAGWRIWWGANLGTGEEQLVAGALGEVGEEIRRRRAAVSQAAGWVMDTYLLRRA